MENDGLIYMHARVDLPEKPVSNDFTTAKWMEFINNENVKKKSKQ